MVQVRSVHQPSIASAATATVLFTIFVLGGSTRTLLTKLGLVRSPEENARERVKARDDHALEEAEIEREHRNELELAQARLSSINTSLNPSGSLPWKERAQQLVRRSARKLRHLDATVLRPLFIGSDVEPGSLHHHQQPGSCGEAAARSEGGAQPHLDATGVCGSGACGSGRGDGRGDRRGDGREGNGRGSAEQQSAAKELATLHTLSHRWSVEHLFDNSRVPTRRL